MDEWKVWISLSWQGKFFFRERGACKNQNRAANLILGRGDVFFFSSRREEIYPGIVGVTILGIARQVAEDSFAAS